MINPIYRAWAVEGLHSLPKYKVIMDWQAIQTPVFFDNTSFCFRNIHYIPNIRLSWTGKLYRHLFSLTTQVSVLETSTTSQI